ncbi:MAG: phosphogluconate dehydratase [Sulfurospirillum sp.]|nr:phosphogluconate dehydratase [Sulfurospirillum sp.]
MNTTIQQVTDAIIKRSQQSRTVYLSRMQEATQNGKKTLKCGNIAHSVASMNAEKKNSFAFTNSPNIAIVSAYNDMLSAHAPYKTYPDLIKQTLKDHKATAQVAGGVPAMCDGVTQSQKGMELSLFSRDNIAMGTAIAMSHNVFDGAIYLGICDKIVPGLLMGALSFGHLPTIFIPAGPMPSGISNSEKSKIRQEFAQGKVSETALLEVETKSYHSCGTCTFYGTANSNQMLLEMMGLQLPNSSFINTNTPFRDALTKHATLTLLQNIQAQDPWPLYKIIDEKSFVNAIVGLMATGGSTNHTIHLIAMAKMAGIILKWEDFDQISSVTPLLCKLYPNGSADVNHFRDAGGMGVIIAQLLQARLVHQDVQTVVGFGLQRFACEPILQGTDVIFSHEQIYSKDTQVISTIDTPFDKQGGIQILHGNIGTSIVKSSALKKEQLYISAPAVVFDSQEALQKAFKAGELHKDFIAVVRYQGPKANGMPELHGLLPALGTLQDLGYKVGLITDGRMSGASGKVPSAIHMSPEAANGGVIAKIQDGDHITLDFTNKEVHLHVEENLLHVRKIGTYKQQKYGCGTELFAPIRSLVSQASEGACVFQTPGEERA